MMNQVNVKTLLAFAEVAERKHFGRAAEQLGMTQSGLSQLIKNLEKTLGVNLIERTTRSVGLTAVGTIYLETVRDVLRAYRLADERMAKVLHGDEGTIRLGFVSSAALGAIPLLTGALNQQFPGLKLKLNEMTSRTQISQLSTGDIDVGIVRDVNSARGLILTHLFSEALLLAVPATHRLADKKQVGLQEFQDEEFIMFPRSDVSYLHDNLYQLFSDAGFMPNVVQETVQLSTILGLVTSNAGVAIVPQSVNVIALPNLKLLPLKDKRAISNISIATRTAVKTSPAQNKLVDVAVSLFAESSRSTPRQKNMQDAR